MRRVRVLLAATAAVVAVAGSAQAAVTVSFPQAETYTDAGPWPRRVDQPVIDGLRRHFERLGERYLGAGRDLAVDVLDVDLAGRYEPWLGPNWHGVRVLRDGDWPRVKLRYTLTEQGRTLDSGEDLVSDQSYLWTAPPGDAGDPLRYEKRMLGDWFKARFGEPPR